VKTEVIVILTATVIAMMLRQQCMGINWQEEEMKEYKQLLHNSLEKNKELEAVVAQLAGQVSSSLSAINTATTSKDDYYTSILYRRRRWRSTNVYGTT